jgi:predicted amidophosphoribosyltransferase
VSHICCRNCRLRFAPSAAYIVACPECGKPLESITGREGLVGMRLFRPEDRQESLPEAIEVALPIPELPPTGS